MATPGLVVDVTHCDGVEMAFLEGELDYFVAGELQEKLRPNGRPIVLDLSGLLFIDAGGIGALVRLAQELAASGSELRVINASTHVRRVFEMTESSYLLAA